MADKAETRSKTAIITGGSRGLGRGVVQALAAHGLDVIALARGAEGLAALSRELENVHPMVANAADELTAGRLLRENGLIWLYFVQEHSRFCAPFTITVGRHSLRIGRLIRSLFSSGSATRFFCR